MNVQAKINEAGQMEVTYRGETRVFDAYCYQYTQPWDGKECKRYSASRVFFGRFRSGSKVWPVSVTLHDNGVVQMDGGHSNKGGIAGITGWFNAESTNISQAVGQR